LACTLTEHCTGPAVGSRLQGGVRDGRDLLLNFGQFVGEALQVSAKASAYLATVVSRLAVPQGLCSLTAGRRSGCGPQTQNAHVCLGEIAARPLFLLQVGGTTKQVGLAGLRRLPRAECDAARRKHTAACAAAAQPTSQYAPAGGEGFSGARQELPAVDELLLEPLHLRRVVPAQPVGGLRCAELRAPFIRCGRRHGGAWLCAERDRWAQAVPAKGCNRRLGLYIASVSD
jgi:hypothetical protein